MTLEEFCRALARVVSLTNPRKAVAVLWFLDASDPGVKRNAAELAEVIRENRIGNPNSTTLHRGIQRTGCVTTSGRKFSLRQDRKALVREWLGEALTGVAEETPAGMQFLDETLWKNTRGYIEKVCFQLNGAHFHGYFDCSAVMTRRLIETLVIEAYEKLQREADIKDAKGNYLMLGELVPRATAADGLKLGREARAALVDVKKQGDRSAHNRRYNAGRSDVDRLRDGLRVAVEELLHIAELHPSRS